MTRWRSGGPTSTSRPVRTRRWSPSSATASSSPGSRRSTRGSSDELTAELPTSRPRRPRIRHRHKQWKATAMKLGFNLLLWTTHVVGEHAPLLDRLKATGYDGVEIPLFEGDAAHYAKLGS